MVCSQSALNYCFPNTNYSARAAVEALFDVDD